MDLKSKKKIKKEDEFVLCSYCGEKIILTRDKHVQLKTFKTKDIILEDKFYHFMCWKKFFGDCVFKAMDNYSQKLISSSLKMMKKAGEMLGDKNENG